MKTHNTQCHSTRLFCKHCVTILTLSIALLDPILTTRAATAGANDSDALVWYQKDTTLAVMASGGKCAWKECQQQTVTAEGVLWRPNKGGGLRLLMDNTSVFIETADNLPEDLSGKLVRVKGKCLVKRLGNSDRTKQSRAPASAYFIVDSTVVVIDRIQSLPMIVDK